MKNISIKLAICVIVILMFAVIHCGGGGGGGGGGSPATTSTVISGKAVDAFIAGSTVTAYQVNANGTLGVQIGTPVTTDLLGNYSINLGSYTGTVYLSSAGGTYTDAATGQPVNLAPSFILSAIVPNASGNVTAQITPLTDMAAGSALFLARQGSPVATAAANANTLISDYFGLSSNMLNTALLDLTAASCMAGADQASVDATGILAGISQLAMNYGVSTPDLVQALVSDVTADGRFDGKAGVVAINLNLTPGPGTIALSAIEGTGMSGLGNSITSFMNSTANACQAPPVSPTVITALSSTNTTVFTSSAKAITTFSFPSLFATGAVNETAKTVSVTVPYGTDVTALVATFTTNGVSVKVGQTEQVSGVTPNSFTSPIPYVVTAADNSTATYAVTVTVLPTPVLAQWARTLSSPSYLSVYQGVAVASDGSVYAVGQIYGTGTYNFGNGVSAAATNANRSIVLVKYNGFGLAQWARTVNSPGAWSEFYSVSAAPDGSVYAAGAIVGYSFTADFGNGVTVTHQGGMTDSHTVLLVKYNSSGVAQWARTTAQTGGSIFHSVAVASDGSVYAAGEIWGFGAYDFGNSVSAAGTGSINVVLVKYNSSGVAQWARTPAGDNYNSWFNSVAVASDGSVYAAGTISAGGFTYDFGNNVIVTGPDSVTAGQAIVLVKYNSAGLAQWAKTTTTANVESIFNGVSVASDGSVYVAGEIYGTSTYNFGNSVFASGMDIDENIVLVKYSSSGTTLWARTVAAASSHSGFTSVSVASDGSVYAAGYIVETGSYNFGNSVTAAGTSSGSNIVLVKYDSTGVAQLARTVTGGSGASSFAGVSAAPDGSVCAAGNIVGDAGDTFNFGNGATATGSSTASIQGVILVKYY